MTKSIYLGQAVISFLNNERSTNSFIIFLGDTAGIPFLLLRKILKFGSSLSSSLGGGKVLVWHNIRSRFFNTRKSRFLGGFGCLILGESGKVTEVVGDHFLFGNSDALVPCRRLGKEHQQGCLRKFESLFWNNSDNKSVTKKNDLLSELHESRVSTSSVIIPTNKSLFLITPLQTNLHEFYCNSNFE